jgi:hypothetical protein
MGRVGEVEWAKDVQAYTRLRESWRVEQAAGPLSAAPLAAFALAAIVRGLM